MRMCLIAVMVGTAAILSTIASGDTVFMKDGRKLVGTVVKDKGLVKVTMPLGEVEVNEADVLYIVEGTAAATATTATATPAVKLAPEVHWSLADATMPDACLFMLCRAPAGDAAGVRQQISQWRQATHDLKRRAATLWLTRDEQILRRLSFEQHLKTATDLLRKGKPPTSNITPETPVEKDKRLKAQAEGEAELALAAAAWPDTSISDFLTGLADLAGDKNDLADERFRNCIERDPLVAAYHQARAKSLSAQKKFIPALEEAVCCLQLRDDLAETFQLVDASLKDVPGDQIKHPSYLKAKELLALYDPPKNPTKTININTETWFMPGNRPWHNSVGTLPAPAYDRLVTRQALGIPIAADVLLVPDSVIENAEAVYVQINADTVLQAAVIRNTFSGFGAKAVKLPLALVRVQYVNFTPVDMEKPAAIKTGAITVNGANLYRQMGAAVRVGTGLAAKPEAPSGLDKDLLPGEANGAIFVDGAFAGLLTGRTDVEASDCGKSEMLKSADLSAWVAGVKKSLRPDAGVSLSFGNRPTRSATAAKVEAKGSAFVVEFLVSEKLPAKAP